MEILIVVHLSKGKELVLKVHFSHDSLEGAEGLHVVIVRNLVLVLMPGLDELVHDVEF